MRNQLRFEKAEKRPVFARAWAYRGATKRARASEVHADDAAGDSVQVILRDFHDLLLFNGIHARVFDDEILFHGWLRVEKDKKKKSN
jgi:hypothetical protein